MGKRMGCGVCWTLLALVVVLVGVAGYRLLIGGHTQVAADGRAEIVLAAADRDIVLAEMRALLGVVQSVTVAVTQNDLNTAAQQARTVGVAAMGQVPPSLLQALPLDFKTLGHSLHADFDKIAADAEQRHDREQTLRQLGDVLGKCVACHAKYRLTASRDGG